MEHVLERIRAANDMDQVSISEFGPQILGEPLASDQKVPALDGRSFHPLSPQLKAFYGFANGWKHATIELSWLAVETLPSVNDASTIGRRVRLDLSESDILARVGAENAAVFAVDDPEQPFQRAYFLFGDSKEPRILDLGSEHMSFADLKEYLDFWARVMNA